MGKNQAYKAMQRSRLGAASSSSVPDQIEDGMVDGSFHSPEWHAARLASLNTSHTITWEEFKRKQKEDELRKGELEADTDKMMREYRAQLDAERAHKLAHGRNHSGRRSKPKQDHRKEKDSKKRGSKRKNQRSKRGSSDPISSSSLSYSSSSEEDDEGRETRRSRSKKSKRKKHRLKKADGSGGIDDNEGSAGPIPLSRFFQSAKS